MKVDPRMFWLLSWVMLVGLSGCGAFRQNVLFKTETSINAEAFDPMYKEATRNYRIEPNDYIAITVYTNKGEALLDPNKEYDMGNQGLQDQNGQMMRQQQQQQQLQNVNVQLPINRNNMQPQNYRVNAEGIATLPMVGDVKLGGLTLHSADSLLALEYSKFYKDPFVLTQYLSKRVVVLGAGGNQVVALKFENMSLLEVLAMSTEVQDNGKATNIRLIRDYQTGNPSVQLIDISTIDGLRKANLRLQPNDVIYIEPRRKFDPTQLNVINTIVSTLTSLLTIIFLIDRIK